jgi:hypothetical protein
MERFRNWKIMAVELVVALFGFCAFAIITMIGYPSLLAIVCMIAAIGPLWLFQCGLRGISIGSGALTMPTRQIMDAHEASCSLRCADVSALVRV